jgi:hypothetical protein
MAGVNFGNAATPAQRLAIYQQYVDFIKRYGYYARVDLLKPQLATLVRDLQFAYNYAASAAYRPPWGIIGALSWARNGVIPTATNSAQAQQMLLNMLHTLENDSGVKAPYTYAYGKDDGLSADRPVLNIAGELYVYPGPGQLYAYVQPPE